MRLLRFVRKFRYCIEETERQGTQFTSGRPETLAVITANIQSILDYDSIILHLNEKWDCDIPFGWIPITGDRNIPFTEVYQADYFYENLPDLSNMLLEVYGTVKLYELCEDKTVKYLDAADCWLHYGPLEYMYTDETFQFVIYFSHESSVTVGGKELISKIHSVWPNADKHIWTTPFYD